jgi:ABC-type lipoprotein export system ATPase subunit
VLSLQSVSKGFRRGPREIPVLRDVSLEVPAGDLVGIYGQRNAGKTVLLKLAAGFETPDSGRVVFEDEDLSHFSRRRLAHLHRDRIGWVARNGPHSPDLPMQDYVALSLYRDFGPDEACRRARRALEKVGVADCASHRWDDLSDTARMLVAIAQALVREPRLLVVDDPTAWLDLEDRERIVGLLRHAAEDGGLGVLMTAPDMPAMLHAHQIRSLHRGRLIAPEGKPGGDDPRGRPSIEERGTVIEFPGGTDEQLRPDLAR